MDLFEATAPLRARPWFGYAFGLLGFLLALWLRLEIGPGLVGYPFITFFPVVVLTTFLGGLAPGLACAVLSGLASWYFFVPPYGTFSVAWPHGVIALGFYAVVVGVDLYLIQVMTRALARAQAAQARADNLLRHERTMFQELQHRVANNMQFVSALLAMQKRRVVAEPGAAAAILDEAADRLRTMARIHRRLHDPAAAGVQFGEHLREICADLLEATGARNIVCLVEAPQADLTAEALLTLSLITTEVVTNSLKHAWPEGAGGTIRIRLERLEAGRMALTVSDDGRGLPPGFDAAESGSLGLRIIRSLAGQLGGSVSIAGGGGTTTQVIFAPGLASRSQGEACAAG